MAYPDEAPSSLEQGATVPLAGDTPWRPRISLGIGLALGIMTALWSRQFTESWLPSGLFDFALTAYFALCLSQLQRRMLIALPLIALGLLLPPVIGMAKYQYLFSAAGFSDLFELGALVRHYGFYGWLWAGIVGLGLGGLLALFCWNLRRPSRAGIVIWVPAIVFWLVMVAKLSLPLPIAGMLPEVPPLGRGLVSKPAPVLLGNWVAFLRSAIVYADRMPLIARLKNAAQPDFGFIDDAIDGAERRNIYVVVLESFMDPKAIKGAQYSAEPLSPLFQRWRDDSGLVGQSPVFGNRSADAEFEILCGLPVTFEGAPVVFPQIRTGQLDCLPRKLARLGWHTEARTITDPRVYNYSTVYPKIGFQDLYFAESIVTTDRDVLEVPSAQAVLSQHMRHVDELLVRGKSFFTYVFGTFGHFPYALDTSKRPYTISVNSGSADLTAYVNSAHYTSLAVAAYVSEVLTKDPTALIVAFGDHRPVLRETSAPIDYPGDVLLRQDVPLLIIDGTRGFIPLHGRLPFYEVPAVIADILTKGAFCQKNTCMHQQDVALRPLPEALLATDRISGRTVDCLQNASDKLCADTGRQTARYQAALATMLGDQ